MIAMGFVVSDAERDQGVVYLDAAQKAVASTHALVIGVGQYASQQLLPVASPTIAARMVADWFLDGMNDAKPGGFSNTEKPLGSLGVLLSELPDGQPSRLAGIDVEVPRASFANVKKAVEAWIDRANSHPDNFLFLFIASHGESFGRRTAFLLEDYGTDRHNATAGMSEIEQFVEALANVDANQQLLIFDCCRTPTPLELPFDQEFGTRLINLPKAKGKPIRRAHVLRSTGLGFEAFGRKDGPTVFAQVLLEALRGLAASSSDDWTVDNFGLARTVAKLLDLHERNGEPLQMPDMQLNAPFVVSAVPEPETVTVFVSLGSKYDFSTCSIRIDDRILERADSGSSRIAPFARIELPRNQARKIAALDAAGTLIGEVSLQPLPPVAFKEFPELIRVLRKKSVAVPQAGAQPAQLSLSLDTAAASPLQGLIAVIRPSGVPAALAAPLLVALAADGTAKIVNVAPGRYDISLDASDGQVFFGTFEARPADTTEVNLHLSGSSAPSSLREPTTAGAASYSVQKGDTWLKGLGVQGGALGSDILAGPVSPAFFRQVFVPGGEAPLDNGQIDPAQVSLAVKSPGIITVSDKMARRLPQHLRAGPAILQPEDQPLWVAATGRGWREIVAVPSLGIHGKFQRDDDYNPDPWMPVLAVGSTPRTAASHTCAVVEARRWAALLRYLARRDFELSAITLSDLVDRSRDVQNAILGKVENPMAAVAGALVAVATRRLDALKIPEQWLRNLTDWFPQLPDGPVILARHYASQGQAGPGREEIKKFLLEAYRRGVPLFSLSVDWLSQGLADLADDPEIAEAAGVMWRVAQLSDPTRTFTVLRMPVAKDDAS
jgi:hypothetical protein